MARNRKNSRAKHVRIRKPSGTRGLGSVSYCQPCNKQLFATRKAAARQIRLLHSERMREYRCPTTPWLFHIGHLQGAIVAGLVTRDEVYEPGLERSGGASFDPYQGLGSDETGQGAADGTDVGVGREDLGEASD